VVAACVVGGALLFGREGGPHQVNRGEGGRVQTLALWLAFALLPIGGRRIAGQQANVGVMTKKLG
jgi:hypothetical protein